MKTKISSITIINQDKTKTYYTGDQYNNLIVDCIKDRSQECPNSTTIIYVGLTKEKELVFEIIDAPIDVQYEIIRNDENE